MAMKNLKREKGFTIIEVLIVLAIAGLIMLVVFLAVPALQRNSRNTQRKNDVSQVIGALQEYSNNHAGQLPTTAALFQSDVMTNAKVGFYQNADVLYRKNAGPTTAAAGTDNSKIYVETYAKCTDSTTIASSGASSRNVIAVYYVERGAGDPLLQCQDM